MIETYGRCRKGDRMPRNPDCSLCSLHEKANNPCVWGRWVGEPTVGGVLILGEAPGYHEDAEGRPFVGRSGELLAEAMTKVGIKNYYLANTVKCFPGKVKPNHEQVKACSAYLDEEMAAVRPKFILALGNFAIQRLIGRGKITELAGKEKLIVAGHDPQVADRFKVVEPGIVKIA